MPWDRVHDEAEVLEHYISEDLEERIAAALGDPSRDPHGDPIPSADLDIAEPTRRSPLTELEPGEAAIFARVSDRDSGDAPLPRPARDPARVRARVRGRDPFERPARTSRSDGARARARPPARGGDAGESLEGRGVNASSTRPPVRRRRRRRRRARPAAPSDVEAVPPGRGRGRRAPRAGRSTDTRRGLSRLWPFLGPAFIACVAYIDPGNFATNIAAGAQFGYLLLWVVVARQPDRDARSRPSRRSSGSRPARTCPSSAARTSPGARSIGLWLQAEVVAMATTSPRWSAPRSASTCCSGSRCSRRR